MEAAGAVLEVILEAEAETFNRQTEQLIGPQPSHQGPCNSKSQDAPQVRDEVAETDKVSDEVCTTPMA